MAALLAHPLDVGSTLGEGTRFTIDVPRASSVDDVRTTQSRDGDSGEDELRGSFVLVIDDEWEVRDAMAMLLDIWGCKALCVAGGAEAVEAMREHLRDPDLVVCDYRLGNSETGLDAIDAVREAAGRDIPAIVLTGDVGAVDPDHIRLRGLALAYKPIHGDSLRRLMAAHLRAVQPGNGGAGVNPTRILIVDDHALLREGVGLLLRRLDPDVEFLEAGTLAEALERVAAPEAIDLLLLDLGLPDGTGVESIRAVHERRPGLPVVVLSAQEDRETVMSSIAAGAVGYVPKASSADVMLAGLRVVLGHGVYLPPSVRTGELAPARRAR